MHMGKATPSITTSLWGGGVPLSILSPSQKSTVRGPQHPSGQALDDPEYFSSTGWKCNKKNTPCNIKERKRRGRCLHQSQREPVSCRFLAGSVCKETAGCCLCRTGPAISSQPASPSLKKQDHICLSTLYQTIQTKVNLIPVGELLEPGIS